MVIWITGASSGLGKNIAHKMKETFEHVVLGARSFKDKEGENQDGYNLYLDVNNEESVACFTQKAYALYGAPDVLICCQGVLNLGACELYTKEELQEVMNTNFIGTTRVVHHTLPFMREKEKGKILLLSSINGVLGIPFQGAYVASKFALEGYAECLRIEIEKQNIHVCVVEPGDHRNGAKVYRKHAERMERDTIYKEDFLYACEKIQQDEDNGLFPQDLGRKIVQIIQKKHLPNKLVIAKFDQKSAIYMHKFFPVGLFKKIISDYYLKK